MELRLDLYITRNLCQALFHIANIYSRLKFVWQRPPHIARQIRLSRTRSPLTANRGGPGRNLFRRQGIPMVDGKTDGCLLCYHYRSSRHCGYERK